MKLNIDEYKQKYKKERNKISILKEGMCIKLRSDNSIIEYMLIEKTFDFNTPAWVIMDVEEHQYYYIPEEYIEKHRIK